MQSLTPLPYSFYARDTHIVARELLGKLLVRTKRSKQIVGRICEVECYVGENDKASHASKGKTKRTEIMFGKAGCVYVYLIYGMYHCLNVVTAEENFPAAILIRACKPVENVFGKTDGPGKLCREFFIDRSFNGHDLTTSHTLTISDDGTRIPRQHITTAPRIGVAYAGDDALLPWRYFYSK